MSSLLTLGLIGLLGFLCQWVSYKVRLPAILFLRPVRRMVSIGVLINGGIMAMATHYLIGLSWSLSALFGALMVVTGPTVIVPMLKTIRPLPKIADTLRWEGIVIDPIGALIAVLVFEWIAVQQATAEFSEIFYVFGCTVLVGFLIGIAAGYLFGLLLRNHLIPESLYNFASLALVCFVFAWSDSIMHESGLLAVTVMGMLLANMKHVEIHSILEFKEDLTVVFVSGLFIILAARLEFSGFVAIGWSALALLLVMQFIARPAKILASFWGSDFNWREQAMISWIGPRGIVAAAVSAVFALRLEELGLPDAEKLVPLAFSIIIGTVVLQSLSARYIAKLLGVAMPKTHGVIIIGANPLSIQIAQALKKENIDNIVCDTNWESLSAARIIGLDTYYGNPSSEHAELHLNMTAYGYMLGLSSHFEYNVMQATSFKEDFGHRNVFLLPPNRSQDTKMRHLVSNRNSGRILFDKTMAYRNLLESVKQGGEIKATEITDAYNFEAWKADNEGALILFTIKTNGTIKFNSEDDVINSTKDCRLIYLNKVAED